MTPTIVMDAAPFCYGPISTLMAVAQHLRRHELELVLLASGTAAEFVRTDHEWLRVVSCNTEDIADLERVGPLLRDAAVFVCNTNPASAAFARSIGCRVVYIDTLFWMWDHIDPLVAASELYLAQDFAGVADNHRRIGNAIENFEIVGPLIADCDDRPPERDRTCIVSFGGMQSSLTVPGNTNRYPWTMTGLLLSALDRVESFDRIVFCGCGWVMQSLEARFAGPGREFRFIPHAELLRELARCRLLLLSPGLTGAFEALALNVPTCLLLAQNYSQHLQASAFLRRAEPPFRGLEWSDLYPDFQLPNHLHEADAIAQLDQLIRRFESDAAMQDRYCEQLIACLRDAPSRSPTATTSAARTVAERIARLAVNGASVAVRS